jgi:glycogen synthase
MKIVHILYQSLPNFSGTSIRSRDILTSQKYIGLIPIAITSPFQDSISCCDYDIIDGIKYYRTNDKLNNIKINEASGNFISRIKKIRHYFRFKKKCEIIFKGERPDLIHAHATFFTGFVGLWLARKYNVPFIYEVRSLWEKGQLIYNPSLINKIQISIISLFEKYVMQKADIVIALNSNLRKSLIEDYKISFDKIHVVPNSVNPLFIKSREVQKRKEPVFGFIGSFVYYEGLEFLIEVFSQRPNSKLLLFGTGDLQHNLAKIICERKITNVILKGTVPHDKIDLAYQEIDVIINPRINNLLTNSVTPLKPLEALARKKIFVGSDVDGIRELVSDNISGFLFKAESKDSLLKIIDNINLNFQTDCYCKIVDHGFNLVMESYNWINQAEKYNTIYKSLLKNE